MRTVDSIRGQWTSEGRHENSPQHSRTVFSWSLLWLVWVPFFIPPIVTLAQAHPPLVRLAASLAGMLVFATLYLWTTWQSAVRLASPVPMRERSPRDLWVPLLVMVALTSGLFMANGSAWGGYFFFSSAAIAGRLPWRQTAIGLSGLALLLILTGRHLHASLSDGLSALLMICIIGLAVTMVKQSVRGTRELRAEREHLARFSAVMEERLRIARDLHDLLGHNLSLIALKSELARRLLDAAPQRAAGEIADIEGVARTALQEVREAVSRYRQPTLTGELHGAEEMLSLAGITCRCDANEKEIGTLPAPIDGVLAWTVREAATNVIRHSHARHCAIAVEANSGCVRVEVIDDGSGISYEPADKLAVDVARPGNGLRGLAERVAELGGRLEAGPQIGGGFRLTVSVPLIRT